MLVEKWLSSYMSMQSGVAALWWSLWFINAYQEFGIVMFEGCSAQEMCHVC